MASELVTKAEMEARFAEERRLTQAMVETAISRATSDQQARQERALGFIRASIQQLSTKLDQAFEARDREWAALKAEVDAAQHSASLALGVSDALKTLLRDAVEDIKADGHARTAELALRIDAHNTAIMRWQNYEKIAGGVIGLAFQLPLLRWLGRALKLLIAVLGGTGLGALLYSMLLLVWR